jgi:PleD family two-component response regulator
MHSVLVADLPELDGRLSAVLLGHRLSFVRTMYEAERRLAAEDFALVIIGLHFDDSRMFDLLRHVRSPGRHRHVPVLCLRTQSHRQAAISSESLKIACEALEGDAFIDFGAYPSDVEAEVALRQEVDRLLKS